MSAELDSELRADFLNESRDLMERLGEQLVELERQPKDKELLNAVFRGFHTIKGGAGFFALDPVVHLCHAAEDVFNALRSQRITLDAELTDVVLEAYEELQQMLAAVAAERPVPAPNPATLETLKAAVDAAPPKAPRAAAPPKKAAPPAAAAVPAATAAPAPAQSLQNDPFSEDEFEALLDSLHGRGAAPGQNGPDVDSAAADEPAAMESDSAAADSVADLQADPFSEDEFEALLDSLHGKGAPPGVAPLPPPPPAPPAREVLAVSSGETESSLRVDTHKLDSVMNLVGELVLVRNRLKTLGTSPTGESLRKTLAELDHITGSLQSSVMQLRMQPIRKLFARFPRLVRDVARKLGKQVDVILSGEDTGLDKGLVEALADPLLHMVRNAIDHGIEMPDQREEAGKPAAGQLRLEASQQGDHILISVRDDGAGMDPEKLRRKAVERGLLDAATAAAMPLEECLQLVFLPGFSTKEQISDLSGRGVGMDVVRTQIAALNGSVQIESEPRRGTTIHLRVPLTLAILPVLMVGVGRRLFALPLQPVQDVFNLDETQVRRMGRGETVNYRKEPLRLLRMSRWVNEDVSHEGGAHVIVVRVAAEKLGLVVSRVRGREEIVVKPLGPPLRGLAGLTGATVTGEGRIALIVDLPGLMSVYEHNF